MYLVRLAIGSFGLLRFSIPKVLAPFVVAVCCTAAWSQKPSNKYLSPAQGPRPQHLLTEPVKFAPKDNAPLDQLIEVAKHFQISMGVEWIDDPNVVYAPLSLKTNYTIAELLSSIVRRAPGYRITINNGIVNVRSAGQSQNRLNVLNLKIQRFRVRRETLFDAQDDLWLAIESALYPERYANGYEGGSGFDPTHPFAKRNISLVCIDLPVREILNRLVKAYGQVIWVAHLKPAILSGKSGSLADLYHDKKSIIPIWEFISLVGY
jgi:hypothetical protein